MIFRRDLRPAEYAAFYEPYLNSIPLESDMLFLLKEELENSINFVNSIDQSWDYRYENHKWSIGEVLMHCIDTERIFAYRALAFMRGDATDLPGFDQDHYVRGLKDYAFAKANIIKSLQTVRAATIDLFETASMETLNLVGVANGNVMSVRSIPFVICGHWKHHIAIIKERY